MASSGGLRTVVRIAFPSCARRGLPDLTVSMRRGPGVTSTCDFPLSQGVTSICVRPMKDAPVNPRRLPAYGIFGTPMTDPACVCTICWLLVPFCVVVVPSCVVVVQGHGGKNRTPQVRLPQPPAAWCYASAEHQAERECPWLCRPCAVLGVTYN